MFPVLFTQPELLFNQSDQGVRTSCATANLVEMAGTLSTYLSIPFFEWKLASTLGLLGLTFVCSYAPWGIRQRFKNSKIVMSFLNCLAGGVVLGALLMHMVPEITHSHSHGHGHDHGHGVENCEGHGHHHSVHRMEGLLSHGKSSDCCGSGSHHSHTAASGCSCGHADHDHKPHADNHGNTPWNEKSSAEQWKMYDTESGSGHDHDHQEGFAWGPFSAGISFLFLLAIDRLFMHSHSHDHDHGHEHGSSIKLNNDKKEMEQVLQPNAAQCMDIECGGKIHSADPENDDCASCHSEDLMGGCHMDGLDVKSSKTQAIVFVIALSMHSFLEGLGLATKNTKPKIMLYIISLFAHKWLEAFALGVNVMNANFSRMYAFLLISFYALLTPLGIVLGMLFEHITTGGPYAELTMMILNGLALGSFLFVSCIEMIPPEFHKKTRYTPWKFLALFLGFLLMAAVSILHSH
ncbi:hypothetical protein PSACC_01328 [Paramicrosporidium saccamoebae]|uniref:Zinc/iron permease n=1 Tax=Paramicrosporidium saccamoebae TaxID=1246581 RepID=A0A2H9TM21_9FUNG|nr:hypothetical protein PSACC_01328 [Paramicrosporidium saccamoebae]